MVFKHTAFKFLLLVFFTGYYSSTLLARPSLIKNALMFFDQENYTEAQNLVDQAIQDTKFQKEASTWYYRGVVYEQLMRKHIALDIASRYLEEAIQAYHHTLSLTPAANQYHSFARINLKGLWLYYLNRGSRYYKAEAFDRAIEQFDVCKSLEPNNPYALLYTAIAAHQEGVYHLASEHYQAYLQLEKGEAVVYRGLANLIAYQLKEPDKAHEILEQAIQQYPWEVNLLDEQNTLLIKLKRIEAKEQQYQVALSQAPTNPLLAFRLGYLYEQLGELYKAAIYYRQAAELAPKQLEPVYRLGIVYYNQAANIINQTTDTTEEAFQSIAKEVQAETEAYLKRSLTCFKQARKLRRTNLFIAKQIYIIYKRLGMTDKARAMEAAIKRMKGGSALLATL
jgi:tetratricopeptide (TPR) repeat protein